MAAGNVQAIGATGTDTTMSVVAATADRLLSWSAEDLVTAH